MNKIKPLLLFSAAILSGALFQISAASGHTTVSDRTSEIRKEIATTPEKSGGVYYAYPVTTDSLPPVPDGYKPVYLSHYGRHGSRWVINETVHDRALDALLAERSTDNLTPEGERVLGVIDRCGRHAHGHWGELSPLGERQHKGIADRMYDRFPELFNGNSRIVARSSVEPRCIISMAAFSEKLKERNSSLDIERHATPGDMDFISYSTPEAKSLGDAKKGWLKKYGHERDSLDLCMASAKRLFRNPAEVKRLHKVMKAIHDVAISIQDIDGINDNIIDVFTPEDLYNLWKNSNYIMYVRHANSIEGKNLGARCAESLLRDIVERADEGLAGKRPAVDLRFGHDTALLRLLALMGAGNSGISLSGAENTAAEWQTYRLTPMAANLQLAFFRNAGGDVLVSVRHNEQPVPVAGIEEAPGAPGYYRWDDLRTLWLSAIHPAAGLVERVSPGSSRSFIFREVPSDKDFFEISSAYGKPMISGNNAVNIAAGLNWYLKYYPHIHLSWNNMRAELPARLPLPAKPERRETDARDRYYLNYCTHSYSMAFWDWERWQQEIDWMALHGINMPLAMTGTDVVWRNTLRRLGYSREEADSFVAGPAFQAWWLMNNLEGWGGPNPEKWYADRAALQHRILDRMRSFGMEPVLPGYSGMVPHDADTRLGMEVSGKGIWNGFTRPAFLKTTDPKFNLIADIYYDELRKLNGPARYYSMDPFHEGGSTEGVDLKEAGSIIAAAMKRANHDAVWVIQGWNENPRAELLSGVAKGDITVLDLASEIKPNWGDPDSPSLTKRADGYGEHDWLFCMILNFGGNVGLHGRMDNVIGGYYKAHASRFGQTLTGVGLTPEGIENNAVMYELLSELIWRPKEFRKEDWLTSYTEARYGKKENNAVKAWQLLGSTIYNCPWGNLQQGTTESIFCARPSEKVWNVSSWSRMKPYYDPEDVIRAARKFALAAPRLKENENYRYDLVDITRQAVAEKGRIIYTGMQEALKKGDMKTFRKNSEIFLSLIKAQDELLSTRPEFSVQTWIDDARAIAPAKEDRDNMERNARLLITTWGPRVASENGGLRDYGHREWAGLLGDLYHTRWKTWIDARLAGDSSPIDFYAIDEEWVNSRRRYKAKPESESVATALRILKTL